MGVFRSVSRTLILGRTNTKLSLEVPTIPEDEPTRAAGGMELAKGRFLTILISLADQTSVSVVRFITAIMIQRCAGKLEAGNYVLSFGFLLIAVCVQDALVSAPFNLLHSRETGDNKRRYHGSVLVQVVVLGLLTSFCFGFAWWIGQYLGSSSGLNSALGALAFATPFVLLREFARRVELARLRPGIALCVDAASGVLQLLFLWFLYCWDLLHVMGVYLATGASCAIAASIWLLVAYRGNDFHSKNVAEEFHRHWIVGRLPFLALLVGLLHLQSVVWIVGWEIDPAAAGIFGYCNYIIFLVNPVALGVCNSLFPLAVQTFRQSGISQVRYLIGIAMTGMGIAVGLFAILAYYFSDLILLTVMKDTSYEGRDLLMLLLGLNMALSVMNMMNDQGVWAIERPQWLLQSTLLTVGLTLLFAVPLTHQFGLNGAAMSLILGRVVGVTYQSALFFLTAMTLPQSKQTIAATGPERKRQHTKISVVTPTLNAARYLSTCLESVQSQTTESVEVQHLILDGGSSDGTLALTSGYPVTLVPRKPGMNLVDAICLGFDEADGDLIVFLGADDLFLPGALDAVARTYQRERRDVLFCRTRWVDDDLKSLGELAPTPRWLSARAHATLGWCYMAASATFIGAELYRKLGGFDRSYLKSSDYEFYTRILEMKIPFSTVNCPISLYRRHDHNESLKRDSAYWRDCGMVLENFAPKRPLINGLIGWMLKGWIYARNPKWSYHQLTRKLRSGTLRG